MTKVAKLLPKAQEPFLAQNGVKLTFLPVHRQGRR